MSLYSRRNWQTHRRAHPRTWISFNGRYLITRTGEGEYRLHDRTTGRTVLPRGTFVECGQAARDAEGPGYVLSPDYWIFDNRGRYRWDEGRAGFAWGRTIPAIRKALGEPNMERLVLLAGLPGSGKTTWLAEHREAGSVYVDATFTKRRDRTPIVNLAIRAGKPASAVVLDTPYEVCVERNLTRTADRRIPDEVMARMRDHWQPVAEDEKLSGVEIVGFEPVGSKI